ncbi:MFS transporter [Microbispora sp. H10885]|uniref:MFS transporter n=1 Tax=Microbispora sp. H10885 TaxID=2729110 RepID=UPI0016001152|nr:MFS transporter [Microbispora sp. H10885]
MTPLPGRREKWALAALSVACFAYVTTEVLPIGLLTVIAHDLRRSPSETGFLVTGYAAVVVLASLPLTRLTRRVPRRALLTATLAVLVLGSLLTAVAPGYPVLLGGRLLIALTQALFWSVVAPTATAMFPPAVRGRVVARMAIGNALAPVLGVPAGTWLGQQAGWRVALAALAVLGLVTCVAVATLLPAAAAGPGGEDGGQVSRAPAPDLGRYVTLVVATVVGVTGFFTAYTYITPYLLEVGGFAPGSLSPLLLAGGVAGVTGTVLVGRALDRAPRGALLTPLAVITCALLGLHAFGAVKAATVVCLCLAGMAFSALAAAIQNRTLQIAPGGVDLASAGTSSAFNVGIAAGSMLGGALIAGPGVHSVTLAGAVLAAVALAALLGEPWAATGARSAGGRAPGRRIRSAKPAGRTPSHTSA